MIKKIHKVSFIFLFYFLLLLKKRNDNEEIFERFNLSC